MPSIRRVRVRKEHRREKRIIYLSLKMCEQCFEDRIEVLQERHTDSKRIQGRKKQQVGRKVRKHGEPCHFERKPLLAAVGAVPWGISVELRLNMYTEPREKKNPYV